MKHAIKPLTFRIVLAAIFITLSACSSLQQPPVPATAIIDWAAHQQQLSELTRWTIFGKLGIRSPEQSNSARFNWQQQNQQFDIQISNLLGQTVASLISQNDEVLIDIAGEGRFITTNPEQLLRDELGWTLPVSILEHWVKGIPAPGLAANQQLNNQGLLETLHQAGWQINFSRYQTLDSHTLPGKIRLQQGNITLTLLIKDWALNTGPAP